MQLTTKTWELRNELAKSEASFRILWISSFEEVTVIGLFLSDTYSLAWYMMIYDDISYDKIWVIEWYRMFEFIAYFI